MELSLEDVKTEKGGLLRENHKFVALSIEHNGQRTVVARVFSMCSSHADNALLLLAPYGKDVTASMCGGIVDAQFLNSVSFSSKALGKENIASDSLTDRLLVSLRAKLIQMNLLPSTNQIVKVS